MALKELLTHFPDGLDWCFLTSDARGVYDFSQLHQDGDSSVKVSIVFLGILDT